MKLSNLFKSKADRLHLAIDNNDLPAMEALMAKKCPWLINTLIEHGTCKKMSAEMAQLLVDKLDDRVFERWTSTSMKVSNTKDVVPRFLLRHALLDNRPDLADLMLEKPVDYNFGKAEEHVAALVIQSEAPVADKLRWLKKTLAGGFDKIEDAANLPLLAVRGNFPEAVGLFAALGFDLHRDNEQLLRTAVREKRAEMCLYLVKEQGADVEAALRPSRELGCKDDEQFLLGLVKDLPPKALPTTLESALAEVQALRQTVRDLSAKVEDMQTPDKTLGKPGLPRPGV